MQAPSNALGDFLLRLARGALETHFLGRPEVAADPQLEHILAAPGATFVTLSIDGELRGCIGSIEPTRPLLDDVRANALAAALQDPRFPAVATDELEALALEVSLLTTPEPLVYESEAQLFELLVPGVDGLVLVWRDHRGTLLPQVWESLPSKRDFLAALLEKAGLPTDFQSPEIRIERYKVRSWTEDRSTTR